MNNADTTQHEEKERIEDENALLRRKLALMERSEFEFFGGSRDGKTICVSPAHDGHLVFVPQGESPGCDYELYILDLGSDLVLRFSGVVPCAEMPGWLFALPVHGVDLMLDDDDTVTVEGNRWFNFVGGPFGGMRAHVVDPISIGMQQGVRFNPDDPTDLSAAIYALHLDRCFHFERLGEVIAPAPPPPPGFVLDEPTVK